MKKITLVLILAVTFISVQAQSFFGLYTFDSVKTTTGITDPSFVPTSTGVTYGSFSATGTPLNPNAAARFSFTNWPTGSITGDSLYSQMTGTINTAEYYEVTVNPATGYSISLDTIHFVFQRSLTGIRTYSVRSSLDGFTSNLTASVGPSLNLIVEPGNVFFLAHDIATAQPGSIIILTGGAFANLISPVTFRFYAWNAEGTVGTFSIDNVRFIGQATSLTIGINEETLSQVSVSPNPSVNGMFNLDLGNTINKVTVSVYNVLGKSVLTKEINSNGKQNLDLSNEPNGVYLLNIKTDTSSITKKIIIAK